MKTKAKTLIIASLLIASLHAQDKPADPYRASNATPAEAAEEDGMPGPNISICYETFSLPLAMAAKIQREQLPDSKLYARILAAVEKEEARQESFTVLRARSGGKAATESISEQIYATEYEPPQLPNTVGVSIIPADEKDAATPVPDTEKLKNSADLESFAGLKTPALPTAFEVRNVGNTLEIEPTLDEDGKIIDLRLTPEHLALTGQSTYGQGESKTEMPIFEKQSISTNAQVLVGQPFLIGTVNRPPYSRVDPDSATRVWFAFVTATFAKP